MRRATPALLAAVLCAALAAPAQAQFFGGDDEARKQIAELRNRIDTMTRNQFDQTNNFETMRGELNNLRGQVEVLQHQIDTMEQRQQDLMADFDRRLQALESGAAINGATPTQTGMGMVSVNDPLASFGTGGSGTSAVSSVNEAKDYETALGLLKSGKKAEALAAFNRFIASYPSSGFLPSAHFWAGTAAMQQRDIAAAQSHYNAVLSRWPSDRMASDAMLGIANTQQALGDSAGSKATLKKLVASYSDSNAAKIARERLSAVPR